LNFVFLKLIFSFSAFSFFRIKVKLSLVLVLCKWRVEIFSDKSWPPEGTCRVRPVNFMQLNDTFDSEGEF